MLRQERRGDNEVRAPFRISAKTAVNELTRHPLFERFKNGYKNSGVSIVACPVSCGVEPRACTFAQHVPERGGRFLATAMSLRRRKDELLSYEEAGVWNSEALGGD